MPHRIDIISGLDTLTNNFLCCKGCQTVVCTFQNVHNTALTVLDFTNPGATTGFSFTVTEINGGAVTWGFVIGIGDTFTLTLEICYSDLVPGNYFQAQFITDEHGPDSSWIFNFTCFTLVDLGVPSTIDFGTVAPSTTQSQYVYITNNTIASFDIDNITTDCPGSVTISPSSSTIPIGATIPFLISWNAGSYPDSVACTITFDIGETSCAAPIAITGQTDDLDCDAGDSICCLNVTLNTENNYLDVYDDACRPEEVYNKAAILEKKQVVYYLKYFEPFTNGTVIYFNICLFDDSGNNFNAYASTNSPPPQYYSYTYNAGVIVGTPYGMNLIGTGANQNNQRNIQAYITFIDPANGKFRITFDFFVVSDKDSIVDATIFPNQSKYKKSIISSTNNYVNTLPSVYLQDEYIGAYVVIRKLTNNVSFLHNLDFTARFYNQGLYGGTSEFLNPTFTLSRNVGVVQTFSLIEQTKITFTINVPPTYNGTDTILFHLVDETLNDNTLQFLDATDSSRVRILNNVFPGVLDNHLLSPSTFTYLGANVYEATCYVDTNLDPTHQYRLFAIVYSISKKVVNTFKTPNPIRVTRIPEYTCNCLPELTSYWSNYFETRQTDDYRPVGKERIKHRLVISEGDVNDCLTSWGVVVDDWRDLVKNIKLRIYKRYSNYPLDPNDTYTSFFEFGTFESVRNNTFGTGWQDLSPMEVIDMNNDIWVIINDVRVRWEDTAFNGTVSKANNNTYMNKIAVTGATATSYIAALNVLNTWIDDDIYFEYEIVFDLSSYFTAPFKFSICRAYMVSAISFEYINSGFPDHIISQYIEGLDSSTMMWLPISSPINYSNFSEIRITYTANQYGWFNFFIEQFPFGIANLTESNAMVSPTAISYLGLPPIVDGQSTQYTGTPVPLEAVVRLDPTQFQNTNYIFCGYWTEYSGAPPCWYFDIHNRIGGTTSQIIMDNIIYDNDIAMTFVGVTTNAYVYLRVASPIYGAPVTGNTYTFHYSFNIPTTRVIRIWFKQMGFTGTPDIILAAGATNGIITFTWPTDPGPQDYWTMQFGIGSNYSGQGVFAIGSEQCDE